MPYIYVNASKEGVGKYVATELVDGIADKFDTPIDWFYVIENSCRIYCAKHGSDTTVIEIKGFERPVGAKEALANFIIESLKDKYKIEVVVYFIDMGKDDYYEG